MSRHGISYRGSVDAELGMAIGGLGTCTFELGRDGSFQNVRLNNAWHLSLNPTHRAAFLSVHARRAGAARGVGRILQLRAPGKLPAVAGLTYTGRFPFVTLDYRDPGLPCRVSLEVFSPFVPRDAASSSVPAAFFTVTLRNPGRAPLVVSAALSWANDMAAEYTKRGWPSEGNRNAAIEVGGLPAVLMDTRQSALAGSEYLLACLPADGVRYAATADWWPALKGRWQGPNVMVEGELIKRDDESGCAAWKPFLERGRLPAEGDYDDGLGRFSRHQPVGAVAGEVRLEPGETREVRFALAWFFPHHYDRLGGQCARPFYGHRYAVRFPGGTRAVADWAIPRRDALRERGLAWRRLLERSSLPPAFRAMAAEIVYLLPRISWWLADGRFCLYESIDCVRMHPPILDRYIATVMAALFPELHAVPLRMIAAGEVGDGEIPSTLGISSVTRPEYRVFNASEAGIFPLSVLWQALWNGDPAFLAELAPVAKRVLKWGLRELDQDGDGIPDVHGVDQGYDSFPMMGTAAYIADQWMAALRAGERLAGLTGDEPFAAWCRRAGAKASRFVERRLWNGRYYNLSLDVTTGKTSDICFMDHFSNGTLPARLLGLGEIHPRARVLKTLDSIWRLNIKPCAFVGRLGANPDGSPAQCTTHPREDGSSMSSCFGPVSIAPLAALAIWYGRAAQGLELVEAMAELVVSRLKTPWSAQLMFNSQTGKCFYGLHYSDMLVLWDVPHALIGLGVDALAGELSLAPAMQPVRVPVFSKFFCGLASFGVERGRLRMTLSDALEPARIPTLTVTLPPGRRACRAAVRGGQAKADGRDASGRFVFRDVRLAPGQVLRVEWR